MAPHRGVLVLVLGILSLVGCGFFTGIPAWIMGKGDLVKIDAGQMDPSGRTLTQVGMILGIVGVVLTVIGCVGYGIFFVLFAGAAVSGEMATPQSMLFFG